MSKTEEAKKDVPTSKKKESPGNPVLNALLGIIALVLIVFFSNWLFSLSSIGNATLDLTEDKVHTLTPGTKAILGELKESDAEVVINYYATRDAEFMPRSIELYMKKVDGFLKRYQALAGENLRIVNLDPQPDTDAEDSANIDGIAGQSLNGENLYLGLSISFLDEKTSIPFLNPEAETQLEYQLSSAIAQVARTDKPTLGLMTPYPLAGGPPTVPGMGQPPSRPFVIYQQLEQFYELKDITMTPSRADLDGLSAVLVIHPAGISPETEFLLDQYLLGGGSIVAALDAFSFTAQQVGGGNPMMGQPGMPTASTFSNALFDSWGVNYIGTQVLADGNYRSPLARADSTVALSLTQEAVHKKDNIITSDLRNLFFVLAGAFNSEGKEGLTHTSLLRSSKNSGLVDSRTASRLDDSLMGRIPMDDKTYDLATHIQGTFQTAFPDGDPASNQEGEEKTAAEDAAAAEEAPTIALTESTEPGNVFLISDSDFISDGIAYQQVFGGVFAARNDNAALLFNILDQVTGSKHLIGSRSRNDSRRPFTAIQDMETKFEQEFGDKLEEKQKELDEISLGLSELIQTQQQKGQVAPEGELKEEYDKLVAKQVEARKSLRQLQKDLRTDKDALATRYTLANLLIVPAVVIFLGLCVFLKRRFSTSAR